jgi:hypothetical protein
LLSAEHIFDLANTAPSSLLTVAPNSFYPETEWRDDRTRRNRALFCIAGMRQ